MRASTSCRKKHTRGENTTMLMAVTWRVGEKIMFRNVPFAVSNRIQAAAARLVRWGTARPVPALLDRPCRLCRPSGLFYRPDPETDACALVMAYTLLYKYIVLTYCLMSSGAIFWSQWPLMSWAIAGAGEDSWLLVFLLWLNYMIFYYRSIAV